MTIPKITGRVTVIQQVLDTKTGIVKEQAEDAPVWDDDGVHIWYWSDGNMSCDCNRASVHGVESECGDGENRRYLLNLLSWDRELMYKEFEL